MLAGKYKTSAGYVGIKVQLGPMIGFRVCQNIFLRGKGGGCCQDVSRSKDVPGWGPLHQKNKKLESLKQRAAGAHARLPSLAETAGCFGFSVLLFLLLDSRVPVCPRLRSHMLAGKHNTSAGYFGGKVQLGPMIGFRVC